MGDTPWWSRQEVVDVGEETVRPQNGHLNTVSDRQAAAPPLRRPLQARKKNFGPASSCSGSFSMWTTRDIDQPNTHGLVWHHQLTLSAQLPSAETLLTTFRCYIASCIASVWVKVERIRVKVLHEEVCVCVTADQHIDLDCWLTSDWQVTFRHRFLPPVIHSFCSLGAARGRETDPLPGGGDPAHPTPPLLLLLLLDSLSSFFNCLFL